MYPKTYSPYLGIFVEEQICALKHLIKGNIIVISPIPWSPKFLWFKKKWKKYGQAEKEKIKNGIKIYYPRYLVIPGKLFFPLQGLFMYFSVKSLIKKLIKTNKEKTILHTHTILPDGFAGILLARKFKFPCVCTIHGSDINIYPFRNKLSYFLTTFTLKRCDHIVTVSNKLKSKVQLVAGKIDNITVIHNGADPTKFKPMNKEILKHELGINGRCRIILFIGNLTPVKGINYLLEAFAQLMSEPIGKDIVLFLIGDGEEKENLVMQSKRLKIEDKVSFLGTKQHAEIPLWLNIADLFVLPSISEGFPTIIPEAMMCGVPVLASDVGGISEIISHGETGLLVKPGDVEGIKKGMRLLLEDEIVKNKMIVKAIEKSRKYTWENNVIEHLKLYEKFLADNCDN